MVLDAIILAAGQASRIGLPKALLPAGPGHTLLSRVITLAVDAVHGTVLIVVGNEPEMMQAEIARCRAMLGRGWQRLRTIVNQAYLQGQSTSLVAAIREVRTKATLVLLVDQPALELDHVRRLVTTWRGRPSPVVGVASASGGRQRTPVVLGAELFPELLELEGDEGARRVLRRHPTHVQLVEGTDDACQMDVDAWDDYVRLARLLAWDRERVEEPSLTGPPPSEPRSLVQEWVVTRAREADPTRRLAALRHLALAALQS
ncbi:MAG: NTP transferase domain-containing protein [Luteitalea sp.]|nr:NTP transferase domain-containing protein [Luteitalea sp.]